MLALLKQNAVSVVGKILLFTAVIASNAHAQSALPPELAQAWAQTKLPESSLSVLVQEIDGGQLVAVNATQPRNPASVMKLVTTYAALAQLGPIYTWRTDLLIDGKATVDAGVLSSPLYIRAGGDPLLLLEDFWRLLRELKLRGITQLNDVVIDRSIFGDVTIDPGSFDGAADRPYNASPDALMVGFGSIRLVFTPDLAKRTWKSFVDPAISGVTIENNLEWVDGKCPGPLTFNTETITQNGEVRFRISGKAAGTCGEFDVFRLGVSQKEFTARALQSMWKELGGTMTGQVKEGVVPAQAVAVASNQSPPLSEVIRLINKRSNNVMTRVLLLTLGAEAGRRPATVQSSGDVAKSVLTRQGIDTTGLVLDNGSGLSRVGVVSAQSLAQLLYKAWQSPVMPEYVSSLSILGVDGTMANRLKGGATQSRGHLKSGALKDVRSVAGYVLGANGKRYIVVSMVNHERAFDARSFENALITWLIKR